jgi:hypothetical protein
VGHFPNYNQVIIRHSAIHAALYRDMKWYEFIEVLKCSPL